MSRHNCISGRLSKAALVLSMACHQGVSLGQDASTGEQTVTPCAGSASITVLDFPKASYEVELRFGSSPGSKRLHGVSAQGPSYIVFDGLCAGEYFFAYRSKGERRFSVTSPLQIKVQEGKFLSVTARVRIQSALPGWEDKSKRAPGEL